MIGESLQDHERAQSTEVRENCKIVTYEPWLKVLSFYVQKGRYRPHNPDEVENFSCSI